MGLRLLRVHEEVVSKREKGAVYMVSEKDGDLTSILYEAVPEFYFRANRAVQNFRHRPVTASGEATCIEYASRR